ncbi:hypothetical protein C8J57DRAFT_1511768 [Mycena rebaudengoi]|nr:hypothetical protein C8J57DRAFT_1511768 [Mycena rebaudengoi]
MLAIPKNHPSRLLDLVTCDYTPYTSSRPVCKAVDGAGLITIFQFLAVASVLQVAPEPNMAVVKLHCSYANIFLWPVIAGGP